MAAIVARRIMEARMAAPVVHTARPVTAVAIPPEADTPAVAEDIQAAAVTAVGVIAKQG
jgi:hypothetical protein